MAAATKASAAMALVTEKPGRSSSAFAGHPPHPSGSTHAAPYTDPTALSGILKPVFGELQWLLPADCIIQKFVPFSKADAVGKQFEEPLQVKTSWGVTFAGSAGDVMALVAAVPSKTVPAEVKPFLTILNDLVSYSMFDRGPDAGKKAFMATGAYTGKNLSIQLRRILEMSMLCGQDGFMEIESYATNVVATGRLVVTAASLRTGILAFLEGAKLDIQDAATTTLIADGAAGDSAGIGVLAVDIDNRRIDLLALPTLAGSATPIVLAGGQKLFLHGANPSVSATANYMEMVGIQKQISATTGTIFAINKATYQAVRGNTVTSVGAISAGGLTTGCAKAINRGFQGEMWCLVSPLTWGELNARNIAQRVFDSSYKKGGAEVGSDAIKVSGNGVTLDVRSHSMVSDSTYLMFPKDGPKRIGSAYENSSVEGGEEVSTDISFMIPGTGERFVDPVQGYNAVKVECRSDQAIYLPKPAHCVYGSGITHT